MTLHKHNVNDIIGRLHESGVIDDKAEVMAKLNGTTDGLVYTLAVNEEPKYVLKMDHTESIGFVEQFHQATIESPLLPKLIYTDPAKTFIVYSYIEGTTHYNRGSKGKWMSRLVTELLNHYETAACMDKIGRLTMPRDSCREFNERSLEGARNNVGDILSIEDTNKVNALVENISQVDRKYLLHGDTGVHNFVYRESELVGVIDPSPMAGPLIYDFTYAYCSSPDELNMDTLFSAYELLAHKPVDRSRLIDEVIFQLYCRIGICARVHPHDLNDYLQAWEYWRSHLK
ncbi:phosphotransferase [Paenibacillus marinisediminis]